MAKITATFKYSDEDNVYGTDIKREGNTIKEKITHLNGELSSIVKYSKYDKTGAEWTQYDKDGKEKGKGSSILNKDGKVSRYNINEKEFYEVNWNEKVLPSYLKNAELYNNSFISYDNGNESILYIEYEYDKKGNWIKQIIYEGEVKEPVTISERTIVY